MPYSTESQQQYILACYLHSSLSQKWFITLIIIIIIIIIIIELVQEIGRRTTVITEDSRETAFLFQRLSVALQRGNAISFLGTFPQD